MAKTNGFLISGFILYFLSFLLIWVGTHIAILAVGIPQMQLGGHATLNLFGAFINLVGIILIIIGYNN